MRLWAACGIVLGLAAAAAGLLWNGRAAVSLLAGGAWHLASVWCLVQLLAAWTASEKRWPVVAWCLVKFPLLYAVVFALFQWPGISAAGFGAGFTLVLVCAVVWLRAQTARMARAES